MSLLITWSEPKLCTYELDMTAAWFVYFTMRNELTGEEKSKQFRGGINYHHHKEDRIREGNALCEYWKSALEKGQYNPWAKGPAQNPVELPASVGEALAKILALKKAAIKKKSFRGYYDVHAMFLEWLTRFGYNKLRLYQFTPAMAQAYLDFLITSKEDGGKGYSGKTHNTHHGILHALFGMMMIAGRKWIDKNPFSGVVMLPEDQGDNIPYTEKERADITTYLKAHDRRMYFSINFLFHCYIRKTELTTIRVGDIDWQNKTIKINSHAAKNRIQDCVTIPEAFLSILLEMGLDMAPKHFYIFGKWMQTCAEQMTRPDDISDRYLVLKKEMGYAAGDGRTFYAFKHTGVIAYWNLLKDPYVLMRQLRHSDLKTTMIYLRSLGLNPNFQFLNASVTL